MLIEVARQPLPRLQPKWSRAHDAVHTEQRHIAQDERRHGSGKIHPLCQTTRSDCAATLCLRQYIRQRVRANTVDGRSPAFLTQ